MAKAGAGGLTPRRVRAVRAFLAAAGYTAVPGTHQHLKFRHPARPPVLLLRQSQTMLSFRAARQIGAALGDPDAQTFVAAVQAQDRPLDPILAHHQCSSSTRRRRSCSGGPRVVATPVRDRCWLPAPSAPIPPRPLGSAPLLIERRAQLPLALTQQIGPGLR